MRSPCRLSARSTAHELLDGAAARPAELRTQPARDGDAQPAAGWHRRQRPGGERAAGRSGPTRPCWTSAPDRATSRAGCSRARDVNVVVGDSRDEVLAIARRNLANTNRVCFLQADVRALPLADGAVDVAHASLLLHHLDPADVDHRAARDAPRRAARRWSINDLRRGLAAVRDDRGAGPGVRRGRYTRHDGVLSARRAYTLAELDDLAAEAGLQPVQPQLAMVAARHDGVPMSDLNVRRPGGRRRPGRLRGRGEPGARRSRRPAGRVARASPAEGLRRVRQPAHRRGAEPSWPAGRGMAARRAAADAGCGSSAAATRSTWATATRPARGLRGGLIARRSTPPWPRTRSLPALGCSSAPPSRTRTGAVAWAGSAVE